MDVLREHLHVLDRSRGQDAVTQIEDVARPAVDAAQHVVGLLEHPRWRAEQQRGIQVSLYGVVAADSLPGLVDRNAPVHADDVATGVAQLLENRRRARA